MTPPDSPAEAVTSVVLEQVPIALYWRATAHTDALAREFELLAATSADDRPVPSQLVDLMNQLLARYGSYDERARQEVVRATERGDSELTIEYAMPASFRQFADQLLQMWEDTDAYCRAGVELFTLAAPSDVAEFRRWFMGEFVRQMAGDAPLPWPAYAAEHLDRIAPNPSERTGSPLAGDVHRSPEGFPVLVLRGEIDLETAPEVRTALQRLRDSGARTIVLDAQEVEFLDSVGISVLIAARERLADDGGGLIVRAPSRQARRTLEIAGLSAMFGIHD